MRQIVWALIFIVAGSTAAIAGKQPKWLQFQQTYASVTGKIKNDTAKMAKARAIRKSVKDALGSMDRTAFYSHVASKEAELFAISK